MYIKQEVSFLKKKKEVKDRQNFIFHHAELNCELVIYKRY